jgi:hypothetical protein
MILRDKMNNDEIIGDFAVEVGISPEIEGDIDKMLDKARADERKKFAKSIPKVWKIQKQTANEIIQMIKDTEKERLSDEEHYSVTEEVEAIIKNIEANFVARSSSPLTATFPLAETDTSRCLGTEVSKHGIDE